MENYDNIDVEENSMIAKKRRKKEKYDSIETEEIGVGNGVFLLLDELPEGCLAKILSLTAPADACKLSCVSPTFRSAAASDLVWGSFLPPEYDHTISSAAAAATAAAASSKKDLFFYICHHSPVLIDNGKRSVSVDKWSGQITSYMIGPRDLHLPIAFQVHPRPGYWDFISDPQSRFNEFVVSRMVRRMKISGRIIRSSMLSSRDTKYEAYLVFKEVRPSRGFITHQAEASVAVAIGADHHHICTQNVIYLDRNMEKSRRLRRRGLLSKYRLPKVRPDGWLEVELGQFEFHQHQNNDTEDVQVHISVKSVNPNYIKGLAVLGIEIRPISLEH